MLLLTAAIIDNLGYRQINNFWRIRGFWQYLTGQKAWGSDAADRLPSRLSGAGYTVFPSVQ